MVYNKHSFNNGYIAEINVTKKDNTCMYILKEGTKVIFRKEGKLPLDLSPQANISKEIKKCIDPTNQYNKNALNEKLQETLVQLQQIFEDLIASSKKEEEMKILKEKENLEEMKRLASDRLSQLHNPLIYIGSLTDWFTAGERSNIMLTFLAYSSQVVLNNPISVIALGESGSGKTHIQEVALSYIPKEFVINEKKITQATLFNRAKQDPYFYEGKIVNYGDMGGNNDLTFAEESKALMKELQSDGYLNKPLSVPDPNGGWTVEELELFGKPCLTYTTVPSYEFDDQEMSRSIFITPRMDNKSIFEYRSTCLEYGGSSYYNMSKYRKEADLIKYMVYDLKDKLNGVKIINPYVSIIINFLKESNYYKRDLPKYNNLLKTITAWNYYNREVYTVNDEKVMYCTLDDVKLFMSLLQPYKLSIICNLSPKATEILQDMIDNMDGWNSSNEYYDSLVKGITVDEYIEYSSTNLSKRSVQNYFKELDTSGFVKVNRYKGNERRFELTDKVLDDTKQLLTLDDKVKKLIKFEMGDQVMSIIDNDVLDEALNINNQYDNIGCPIWCD